ncbi:MAG: hypothetical protein PHF67_01605 [Candidatus Nanoarchaeia archaeon]|nr:hypothetical protein [Candidatus Nanoarchaeia archaeon]
MVIESIDQVVNVFPDLSASIAHRLLVGTDSENLASRIPEAIGSRVFGYFGGLGIQALTVGYVAGHCTNSFLAGFGAGVSSAAVPFAVKTAKFGWYMIRGSIL